MTPPLLDKYALIVYDYPKNIKAVAIMTALIFPGQGSQEPGMGKAYYESEVFAAGSRVTGRDLAALCESDAATLSRTENAQLALFSISMAMLDEWRKENEPPAAVSGFSLGECSALVAAGCLSLEDGFRLVQKRAEAMQTACDSGMNGAMSALLGGDPPEAYEEGEAWAVPVNFNCPGQTVVAGTPEGVAVLEERCKASGGRAARLALSGAFHTKMMAGAAAELKAFAQTLNFKDPSVPLYTNVTAEPLPPGTDFPAHLERHMTSPVLWQKCIENMKAAGITQFAETGHGGSLGRFLKRMK
jgi:[acyl-carrier-protein] S-malonyltransferase